jgi:hypothetical protein
LSLPFADTTHADHKPARHAALALRLVAPICWQKSSFSRRSRQDVDALQDNGCSLRHLAEINVGAKSHNFRAESHVVNYWSS